ncbi:DNA mismatch repair endonuclease MutL [Akkermansiaceae bacterium]|nr:DNA mismatch repair endonuclease MutL [Akkermansiaceae bacterium]MDA7869085.1 DNA mismatch repair endonuclease MutL [Akkermansiaceae bacterium]MDA7875626.1 DNA mismatch repair endonuclease MutL [Akkermansiaceae bacterium]MDB4395493.1 DNA mismatch repair endonuclease MutL [Akkermansiaceae bacterium]MDB4417648.1 DNA mismatch repair endonuclease MutL [Akkermansiaceae bacterium]
MPIIEVMPETLASQVAAGEVIERPASVIKELVENAIDAGARKIEVEIQRGGIAMLRVRDDGCGMSQEDTAKSLERHATSKLRTSDDLNGIATLGFRGEALPSIASVSRFTIRSREADSAEGTEIRVDGGKIGELRASGCAVGTSIEVRDLFYNVPARKKFLKAESTEAAHIEHQIRLHALCTPGIGWLLRKDGRVALDLPATSDRRVRIEAMSGGESGKALIEVPRHEYRGMVIEGAILPVAFARRGRKHQFVFLNGRPVEDYTISRAIREAFKGGLQEGLQPAAWLWILMDPALVDVNVHPAKREVRFAEPAQVRIAILDAIEQALRPKDVEAPGILVEQNRPPQLGQDEDSQEVILEGEKAPVPTVNTIAWRHEEQKELKVTPEQTSKIPEFRIVGTLSKRYALLEGEEGLVLLEPQAARERIFYERLICEQGEIESQGLLVPVLLELDVRDIDLLMRFREHFDQAGFTLESFGGQTVTISAAPSFLNRKDIKRALIDLVDLVIDREGSSRVKRLAYEGFASKVSYVLARQDGWSESSLSALLDDLFKCDLPYCDPAGRPTLVQISFQELDRKFGKS